MVSVENQNIMDGLTCFIRLAEPSGALARTLKVMETLANSGNGLGEVLRDYAEQASMQMDELQTACQSLTRGKVDAEIINTLKSAHTVLYTAASVLDMTPAAMLRNHAETLGTREKISREEIVRVTRIFKATPEVAALLACEEACEALLAAALRAKGTALPATPPAAGGFNHSSQHCA